MRAAELAARVTAAAAVLADYQRAAPDADVADRAMWGARLADALSAVLAGIERPGSDSGPAADKLREIRELFAAFDWERDDRQYALERIERIAVGAR